MNIFICGDTHCNLEYTLSMIDVAHDLNSHVILVAGDFGIWGHIEQGVTFLSEVSARLAKTDITLMFVDGNHENHDILAAYQTEYFLRYDGVPGLVPIKPNILYIPRGHIFSLGGKTFMGFGGAYSVDRANRILGHSWWAGEEITQAGLETAIHNFKTSGKDVDCILSHEGPLNVAKPPFRECKEDPRSQIQRGYIQTLLKEVQPSYLFFGHYHTHSVFDYKVSDTLSCQCFCLPGTDAEEKENEFIFLEDL